MKAKHNVNYHRHMIHHSNYHCAIDYKNYANDIIGHRRSLTLLGQFVLSLT